MRYIGILSKDKDACTLADDVQRGVYSDNPTFFLSELEAWFKRRVYKLITQVEVYEDDHEVGGITVYMRCLEAVGVDVAKEAEHVRQIMRDAIKKSDEKVRNRK